MRNFSNPRAFGVPSVGFKAARLRGSPSDVAMPPEICPASGLSSPDALALLL